MDAPLSGIANAASPLQAPAGNLTADCLTNYTWDGPGLLKSAGSTNYSYDEPGNLLSDGTHSYQYDLENRISCVLDLAGQCSQNAIQYFYDPQGRRVGKQQGNTLEDSVYDPQGHVISVHAAAANLLRAEFYAGGRHVATWNAGELLWNHADGLGTERARTDAAGNVATVCLDSPFGMNLSCTSPTDASPIHLAGMEYDSETGTYHTLHRQYQGGLGRWLTADPAGKEAVYLDDPQTWNMYAYVRNNPLTLTDPTGEWSGGMLLWPFWAGQALAKYVKQPPPPPDEAQEQKPSQWPHGGGVGVGASGDAGIVVTGVSATGSVSAGAFYKPGKGVSTSATATGGITAYFGKKAVGKPTQDQGRTINFGAAAGAGAFAFVTNATSASQLSGHFKASTLNVGFGPAKFSIQLSTGNGIWELSVGPPYGGVTFGASVSSITTETCTTPGGCH